MPSSLLSAAPPGTGQEVVRHMGLSKTLTTERLLTEGLLAVLTAV